jgi:gamma-glutamyl hydrolase
VGILAQPPPPEWAAPPADAPGACHPPRAVGSYIAASYVKFVEAGGARAVPIRYDAPAAELARLFRSVNALLLPGGEADVARLADSGYARAGALLWAMAADAAAVGNYFAVHGTCLGWEQIAVLAARNASALTQQPPFASSDGGAVLEWAPAAAASRLFGGEGAAALRAALAAEPAAYESHTAGVEPRAFDAFPKLAATLRVLSTSRDANGRQYVSTAEGVGGRMPLTATQWHPEKALFEWNPRLAIPRGGAAAAAASHVAAFIGTEARRSAHLPRSAGERDAMLAANGCAVFTGAARDSPWSRFDQVYFFEPWGDQDNAAVAALQTR